LFRKIIWQLIFSYLLVILFSMGITGFFLLTFLENHLISTMESTLSSNAQVIAKFWESHFVEKSLSLREKRMVRLMTERLAWQSGSRIRIIDAERLVLMDTGQSPLDPPENRSQIDQALEGKKSVEIIAAKEQGAPSIISMAYPIKLIKGSPGTEYVVGAVYITRSLAYVREILHGLQREYTAGILISLVALGCLSILLSAYISGPIREMTRAAGKIAEGDLSYRIKRRRGDEIGELARRFDYMRERLKNTLTELLEEKNKLSAVLSNMVDGVIVFGSDSEIMMLNNSARSLLGTHDFMDLVERFRGDSPPFAELRKTVTEALRSGQEGELMVKGFMNHRVAEVSFSPLKSDLNEYPGLVMILHDITELQRLDEMKTEFVTNVSHELKTPLASIKGFAELLLDGAMEDHERAAAFLMSIDREVDRLTRLVKSLLDLSKMESGLIKMEVQPVDLAALAEAVTEKLTPQARALEIRLERRVVARPLVRANSDRLQQVLINLIDNALRYAPRSSEIRIEIMEEESFGKAKVIDHGPGLSPEDQTRVFDRFYRVDKARSRDHGGSGLGLAIVRQIIENLGGKIWVESTPGEGCSFIFTLPLAADKEHTKEALP
jgi:signal transduction histidine kinase